MSDYKRLTKTMDELMDPVGILIKCRDRLAELEDKIENDELIEVKHGKWIFEFDNTHIYGREACSVCGKLLPCVITRNAHYCPFCGAKMDLEEEE